MYILDLNIHDNVTFKDTLSCVLCYKYEFKLILYKLLLLYIDCVYIISVTKLND